MGKVALIFADAPQSVGRFYIEKESFRPALWHTGEYASELVAGGPDFAPTAGRPRALRVFIACRFVSFSFFVGVKAVDFFRLELVKILGFFGRFDDVFDFGIGGDVFGIWFFLLLTLEIA